LIEGEIGGRTIDREQLSVLVITRNATTDRHMQALQLFRRVGSLPIYGVAFGKCDTCTRCNGKWIGRRINNSEPCSIGIPTVRVRGAGGVVGPFIEIIKAQNIIDGLGIADSLYFLAELTLVERGKAIAAERGIRKECRRPVSAAGIIKLTIANGAPCGNRTSAWAWAASLAAASTLCAAIAGGACVRVATAFAASASGPSASIGYSAGGGSSRCNGRFSCGVLGGGAENWPPASRKISSASRCFIALSIGARSIGLCVRYCGMRGQVVRHSQNQHRKGFGPHRVAAFNFPPRHFFPFHFMRGAGFD
jgi:hypothetical protein